MYITGIEYRAKVHNEFMRCCCLHISNIALVTLTIFRLRSESVC